MVSIAHEQTDTPSSALVYRLAKHPPSAGFPSPSEGAAPPVPPSGLLGRPFGKEIKRKKSFIAALATIKNVLKKLCL